MGRGACYSIIDAVYQIDSINRLDLSKCRKHHAAHTLFSIGADMLGVGQRFPEFALTGVISSDPIKALQPIRGGDYAGKWLVVFFWPKDFTFVCPTEIAAFGALQRDFQDRDAQLLGVSIDSEYVHLAWRRDRAELRELPFPML